MKTLTATLLAAALLVPGLSAPAMAQQQKPHQQHDQQKPQHQNPQIQPQKPNPGKPHQQQAYKTFHKGEKFDHRYAKNYQVIDYRKYHRLPAPKRGYRYVRAGSDILLIGTSSFKVYAVYNGLIR